MLFILMLLFFGIFFIVTLTAKNEVQNISHKEKPCPPHRWEEEWFYDQFGEHKYTLRCKKCNRTVGEING